MADGIITGDDDRITMLLRMMGNTLKKFNLAWEKRKPLFGGEQYLTNSQVSKRLHVSTRTLQDHRDNGVLPFIKLEGKVLYRLSDIEKLLEDNYFNPYREKENGHRLR